MAIVGEILEKASSPLLKSSMLYEMNMSSAMLNRYLILMKKARLLEEVPIGNKVGFQISYKGMKFLQFYHRITELLETDERSEHITRRGTRIPPSSFFYYNMRATILNPRNQTEEDVSRVDS
jgi:predicted transcriptional regulator